VLLDVGCGWGRWCISAARKGYTAIGIDPGLDSILAARRVSRQLGLPITYLVADARRLPFRDDCVDTVFSYSVFQHFKKPDVCASLAEIGRVLKPGRTSLVQMASAWGVRNLHSRLMRLIENIASDLARRPRSPDRFDVRYWRPRELKDTFARCIGPSILIVDGFFGLNVQ
jgi:ubiquinone/menaquinone biosynthesis C-methylase UbiE